MLCCTKFSSRVTGSHGQGIEYFRKLSMRGLRCRPCRCRVHILKFHKSLFECTLLHTNAASAPLRHGHWQQNSHQNIIRIVPLLSVIAPLVCCPQQKTDMSRMMRRTGVQGNRFGRVCATKHMNTGVTDLYSFAGSNSFAADSFNDMCLQDHLRHASRRVAVHARPRESTPAGCAVLCAPRWTL